MNKIKIISGNGTTLASRVLGHLDTNKKHYPKFVEITDDTTIDSDIPTLIIGYKNAVSLLGKEKVNILNSKINDTLFWTFTVEERKDQHIIDVTEFVKTWQKRYFKSLMQDTIEKINYSGFSNELLEDFYAELGKIKNKAELDCIY